jgi:hypothetical protein
VDVEQLNALLEENHKKKETLQSYLKKLTSARHNTLTLEDRLDDVKMLLEKIKNRINDATYEEKRNAVVALVKEVQVDSVIQNGKFIPTVNIIYKFDKLSGEKFLDPSALY